MAFLRRLIGEAELSKRSVKLAARTETGRRQEF
jgi:hypothetical protein